MASFGDIISIGLGIISNKDKILPMWSKIEAVIQEVMTLYPDIRALISEIAPQLVPAATATSAQKFVYVPPDGLSVTWLQQALNTLMNAGLTTDGVYGPATQAAVSAFQTAKKLTADGWAGVATSAAIHAALAKVTPAPAATPTTPASGTPAPAATPAAHSAPAVTPAKATPAVKPAH
jgi:peptidoglycan hydrolase-like protein with peptidoglycan-binding domain